MAKSLKQAGHYTSVFPLLTHEDWLHNAAQIKRLSKLADRIAELEKNSKKHNNIMINMDINEILKHLPHRYPFLLVDRVVDMELGKSIHAYKNVTINEPFFTGHFPHYPVMPGVLIMEALAQAGYGISLFKTTGEIPSEESVFFLRVSTMRALKAGNSR